MLKNKCIVEKEMHSGINEYINRDYEFQKEQNRGLWEGRGRKEKGEMIYSQKLN